MTKLIFKGLVGSLPTSEFELQENGRKIGFLQIRHRPSHTKSIPESMASHVYYEIEPQYRRKGYGKEILRLGLKEAVKIGLRELFITCTDENVASKKIIEANGGKLIEETVLPKSDQRMLKYRIALA